LTASGSSIIVGWQKNLDKAPDSTSPLTRIESWDRTSLIERVWMAVEVERKSELPELKQLLIREH
jgi:hypothetical protein